MTLRLATYNVEWMNALFDDRGHLLADRKLSSRYEISRAEQLTALGVVFTALNADGVIIIEAPDTNHIRSTARALETFAHHFKLRARKAVIGFVSSTEQEIAFLYDPDRLTVAHDPLGEVTGRQGGHGESRFDQVFRYDLDSDGISDLTSFSKPPLELAVTSTEGHKLRLIGVHAKSKAPHGRVSDNEFRRISIENRRKQLAECLWLRARAEQHLTAGDHLIIMGDFNDGPGLDEYEQLFGRSGVEIVLGAPGQVKLSDPNAELALASRVGLSPTSARFYLAAMRQYFEALLDFIMVSPNLAATHPKWRIWHPFNDPALAAIPELHDALLTASDHFPVTIDLTAPGEALQAIPVLAAIEATHPG